MIADEICEIEIGISERCFVESFDDRIRRFGTGPFDQLYQQLFRHAQPPLRRSIRIEPFHQLFAGAPCVISEDIIVIDDPVQRSRHVRPFERADCAGFQSNA